MDMSSAAPMMVRLGALLAAAGLLWLAGELAWTLPGVWILVPLVAVAFPIWLKVEETAHLARRSLIDKVTTEASLTRRLLWRGALLSAWHALMALVSAGVLLAAMPMLAPAHWALILADAALLALLGPVIARWFEGEIEADYAAALARRWPIVWANLVFLAIGMFVIDYFLVGAPDTRGQGWDSVVEGAYLEAFGAAGSAAIGALGGVIAALDALAWHVAQAGIPTIGDAWVRLGAWAVFLAGAGVVSTLISQVFLGVAAACDARRREAGGGRGPELAAFFAVIALAAGIGAGVSARIAPADLAERAAPLGRLALAADPCGNARPGDLADGLAAEFARAEADAHARSDATIAVAVDRAFAQAEGGVDRFLDWYFTVLGEYERLAALATGDLAETVAARLRAELFGHPGLGAQFAADLAAAEGVAHARLVQAAGRAGARAAATLAASPCLQAALPDWSPPDIAATFGAPFPEGLAVVAGGVAARQALRLAGTQVARRMIARAATGRAIGLAARGAARRGSGAVASGVAGGVVCAPGGPLALVCGVGAFIGTWLAIDAAAVEIDEALHRPAMRAEILAELSAGRAALTARLQAAEGARIAAMADALSARAARFIPAESG